MSTFELSIAVNVFAFVSEGEFLAKLFNDPDNLVLVFAPDSAVIDIHNNDHLLVGEHTVVVFVLREAQVD
jgi:hypothetical protein